MLLLTDTSVLCNTNIITKKSDSERMDICPTLQISFRLYRIINIVTLASEANVNLMQNGAHDKDMNAGES